VLIYGLLHTKQGSDTLQRITDHKNKPKTVLLLGVLNGDTKAYERIVERLESVLLEVLEATVESACTRNKQQSLQRANLRLEIARHLWRLNH
jgi:hypothetical protein